MWAELIAEVIVRTILKLTSEQASKRTITLAYADAVRREAEAMERDKWPQTQTTQR
jgi:hypothetical protein